VNVSPVDAYFIVRILLFAGMFLETVIATCVITYGVEIEQRDIRWENFIQEEITLIDTPQG